MMKDIVWTLASLGQLAITLEASAPKPGNVNRLKRFSDTGYRHFLASAALVARGYYLASSRGHQLAKGLVEPEEVKLGLLFRECISDVFQKINRSNAIFGTILLHIPLLVGATATISEKKELSVPHLQKKLKEIIDAGTVDDTINLYHAFIIASPRGDLENQSEAWSEEHDRFNINNPDVFDNIREDGMTLPKMFEIAAKVDSISREWMTYFESTLNETLPYIDGLSDSLEDLEEAIVRTFVWRLSQQPDGLIIKKAGNEAALRVMNIARRIVEVQDRSGGSIDLIDKLDRELRRDGNLLNPGTTADLISAVIFCKLAKDTYSNTG